MYKYLHIGICSLLSAAAAGGIVHLTHAHLEGHFESVALADEHGEQAAAHATHWGYDGEGGPEHWAELDPGNQLCEVGPEQSPIDLDSSHFNARQERMKIAYKPSRVSVVNNGHTVQYNYDPGSFLTVGGKRYEVLQFHFHASSEHTVYGMRYPLEAHIVHKAEDGSLAVIGVLFKKGTENATLKKADWAHMPTHADETYSSAATFNVKDLIPGGTSWRYGGSLTTPPCSEGVAWHVYHKTVTLSADQLKVFTDLYDHNFRPTQRLDDSGVASSD